MAKDLSLAQAVNALRDAGYKLEAHPTKPDVFLLGSYKSEYDARGIYKLYRGAFERGRSYKSTVKTLSNGKDRAATRDAIRTEKFDSIPSKKRLKEEDPWAWD